MGDHGGPGHGAQAVTVVTDRLDTIACQFRAVCSEGSQLAANLSPL